MSAVNKSADDGGSFSSKVIYIVFIILLLDLLGFTLILPLLPSILDHYAQTGDVVYQSLQSVVDWFREAVGIPLEKKYNAVLFGGLISSYAVWAVSRSFSMFLLFRVIGGICKGNVSLCTAIVADLPCPKARNRGMAMIGIAFSLGFTVGPLMGAYFAISSRSTGNIFYQTPALLALAFSVADLVFIWLMLPETFKKDVKHFSLTSMQQGKMFFFIGVIMALIQGGYARRIKPGHHIRVVHMAIIALIPAFILIGLSWNTVMLYSGLALYSFAAAIVVPCLSTLVSDHGSANQKGTVMGILRSLGALARALGPVVASSVYWIAGAQICFLLTAASFVIPLVLLRTAQRLKEESGMSPKQNPSNTNGVPAGKGGNASRCHGYSSSRPVRETSNDFRSVRDPQAKISKSSYDSPAQGRVMGKSSLDAQRKGFRGARSAPNSAGKSKPTQTDSTPFEVKMTDFPELAGVSLGKAGPCPLVQRECWGPAPPSTSPLTQASAFSWKSARRASPSHPDPKQIATNHKPESSAASPDQMAVTSWANVASQPPKKPVPKEKTISGNHMQTEEVATHREDGAAGKKKRKKKKKKAKGAGEDAEAESEEGVIYQEPPKFEDEEEFPGLTLTGIDRYITSSSAAKLCSEKAEKVSGKKSKVPVQLDIGNMLAALEKKQQFQKDKQDAKPVILSVGGGLPVVQKQPLVQKKLQWQQTKIAHNPLDSTSPLVKKGKQREVPKAKKPTPLKKVILKEREERKQRRLLEERGLLPENECETANDAAEEEEEKCDTNATDDAGSLTEELDDQSEMNGTNQLSSFEMYVCSYCSQMLSKDVDECVTSLLKELVRFQDRLYQKDPMKARMKRRIVMGLREVLKHLKLRKVKCVIISPNCERIQSKGGLDEALYTIIDTCREQGVPFVFALSRKALGRCVNKAVPVSLVGIFNYDGAQDYYHKMIELSSEARTAYEVMVSSLEQTGQAEAEQVVNAEEEISNLAEEAEPCPDTTPAEEPEYIKIWKKMLEKECNHTFLNFEEQLSLMCLESDCTENTEDEKS
ncbi:Selenocysteine insertion sequence-binding protein 2 [Nibea albiflora]|uniref:Selenocysteine insertion sequence-binding protein 2 n=1 Tax=Nibea albiflora TaxID=240163 RepID=A0ACB7FBT8_NIBAL|nr:Selenocysteine insertion sequence-binding protein 2 [Nibea albiflora]